MKEILASSNGSVSSIDCINFSSAIQKLSKSEAQKALDKFFTSQWLKEVCFYQNYVWFEHLNHLTYMLLTERWRSVVYGANTFRAGAPIEEA